MTDFKTRINIPDDVLFHELEGEAVLLNLHSGKYFGLDPIGTRIWSLLAEHGDLPTTYRALLEEYIVDAERLKADLLTLVDRLAEHGLVNLEESSNNHDGTT